MRNNYSASSGLEIKQRFYLLIYRGARKMKHQLVQLCFLQYLFLVLLFRFVSGDECCQINNHRQKEEYHLIQRKARSSQIILSSKIVSNLRECKDFAFSRNALALNFGKNNKLVPEEENGRFICQALECPEKNNLPQLYNDTNFKYYSLYSNNISSDKGRLICVPRVGMFVFSNENLNFTEALKTCEILNGTLARVTSEERTNGLASLISTNTFFVGLSKRGSQRIWTNSNDQPLSCYDYRAWGENEPSNPKGCVGLTKSSTTNLPFWKVLSCRVLLPFICEIFPSN